MSRTSSSIGGSMPDRHRCERAARHSLVSRPQGQIRTRRPQHEIEGDLLTKLETSRTCAPVSSTIAASGNCRSASWATTARRSTTRRASSRAAMRRPGSSGPSPSNAALDRPEIIVMPEPGAAGRARHLDGDAVGDAQRRHDRRYRREPCQVHRRRPPDPDPRPAERDGRATIWRLSSALPVPTAGRR